MYEAWHVRGVSAEHRRRAKVAAAGAGQALGKWLETAIANQADLESGPRPGITVEEVRTLNKQFTGEAIRPKDVIPYKQAIPLASLRKVCLTCHVPIYEASPGGYWLNEDGTPHICMERVVAR